MNRNRKYNLSYCKIPDLLTQKFFSGTILQPTGALFDKYSKNMSIWIWKMDGKIKFQKAASMKLTWA